KLDFGILAFVNSDVSVKCPDRETNVREILLREKYIRGIGIRELV
ncbi:2568_t:CDS:1, partial [Funneliformis geosporum]